MKNYRYFNFIIVYFGVGFLNSFGSPRVILPPPKITNIEISGKDHIFQKEISGKYFDDIIKIYLSTPYDSSEGIKFYYGFNKISLFQENKPTWQSSPKNFGKFQQLSPGKYKIYTYYEIPNVGKSKSVSFEFTINKPWWRTWWFWGASFISLFGMFYGREKFLKFWAEEEQKHLKQIVELELRTLQLQMNPHFIFNALNSIQSYVLTQDPLAANNYLSKFAHLIRMFLDSSRSKYISLNEEIKMLTLYIEMESMRFEGKFDFEIKVEPDVNKYTEIPTMILQPFVENAINHGLRYKKTKGKLSILFSKDKNNLICKIVDNGVGRILAKEIQSKSKKGYKSQGLQITEERLNTYNKINDSNIEFLISDYTKKPKKATDDIGTEIIVRFPNNW